MYTADCKVPDCAKCKKASSEQSSERESQSKNFTTIEQSSKEENVESEIPKTVEPTSVEESRRLMRMMRNNIAEQMIFALMSGKNRIKTIRELKEEVHLQVEELIDVFREREMELCNQIEEASVENKKISSGKMLDFDSDYSAMKKSIQRFGQLNYIDAPDYRKKRSVLAEFDIVKTENPTVFADDPSAADFNNVFSWERCLNLEDKLHQTLLMEQSKECEEMKECNGNFQIEKRMQKTPRDIIEIQEKHLPRICALNEKAFERTQIKEGQPETISTISSKIMKRMRSLHNKIMEDRRKHGDVMYDSERKFRDKSSENALEAAQKGKKQGEDKECELSSKSSEAGSLSSEEVEKESSWDEDDIEIISKSEAASIPPELLISPPLPPQKLFRFSRKHFTHPLLEKKDAEAFPSSENGAKYESESDGSSMCSPIPSGSNTEKNKSPSMKELLLLLEKKDAEASLSSENGAKFASSGIGESESDESSMCNTISSGNNTEKKQNPSFNEQPGLGSSNNCFNASKDEGYYLDPSVALRCSFKKYLKKNSVSEWLAPIKSSEKVLPSGNGCISKNIPILGQDSDQHSFESALRPLEPLLPAKKIAEISDRQYIRNEKLVSDNCSESRVKKPPSYLDDKRLRRAFYSLESGPPVQWPPLDGFY